MRRLRLLLTACLLPLLAPPAAAQHGEVQLGAVASYGGPTALGVGAGPVAGIVLGRLAYFGVRWVTHQGGTDAAETGSGPGVEKRADVFLADIGLVAPGGPVEIVPAVSIGAIHVIQPGSAPRTGTDVLVAPGIAVHVYLAGLVLIPECQYFIAGRPDLEPPTSQTGPVFSLRLVLPIEVGRIRY